MLVTGSRNTTLQEGTGSDVKIQTGSNEKKNVKFSGLGCGSCQRRARSTPYYAERRKLPPEADKEDPMGETWPNAKIVRAAKLGFELNLVCRLEEPCFTAARMRTNRDSAQNRSN